jgi:hypothetical protein
VTAPGCTKQILNERSALSNRDLIYYMLNKFFGDRGAGRSVDPEVLFNNISKQLHGLMREPFLSNAIAVTVRYIQNRTPNLVSFAGSWVDQTMWERAAHVEVVPSSVPTVEASLFPLVRNFVGDLACEVLMGRNFMEVRHSPSLGIQHESIRCVDWRASRYIVNLENGTLTLCRIIRIFLKTYGPGMENSIYSSSVCLHGYLDWHRHRKPANVFAERSKNSRKHCSPLRAEETLEVDGTTCPTSRQLWSIELESGERPMLVSWRAPLAI